MTRPLAPTRTPSFGIMTPPQQVSYQDLPRVRREADSIPQIQHAWPFDQMLDRLPPAARSRLHDDLAACTSALTEPPAGSEVDRAPVE